MGRKQYALTLRLSALLIVRGNEGSLKFAEQTFFKQNLSTSFRRRTWQHPNWVEGIGDRETSFVR